jgi:hypothetical protein
MLVNGNVTVWSRQEVKVIYFSGVKAPVIFEGFATQGQ